jgi:hypothetical protein
MNVLGFHRALAPGLAVAAVICVIAVLLVRLPPFVWGMALEDFYLRNLPTIIFAGLTSWFIVKNRISEWKHILLLALSTAALTFYLNLLPEKMGDTHILAVIHAPIFMVFIFALAWVSFELKNTGKVSGFLRYCGELAIIVFSLSEMDKSDARKLNTILLFLLTVVSLLIDLFALAAIMDRFSEGFTPNRTVVLVSNILILVNLALILPGLYLAGFRGKPLDCTERIISGYLPVYFVYSAVVIFLFPLVF